MSDSGFPIEDPAEIAALGPDHPRRRALERSPRGRALLAAYRSFAAPSGAPEGARVAEADERIGEALARELGAMTAVAEPGAARSAKRSSAARGIRWLSAPALRPAYAILALAIVTGGVWLAIARFGTGGAPHLRGSSSGIIRSDGARVLLHSPRAVAGGALELSWEPFAGADRYTIMFFAGDLSEISTPLAVTSPRFVLAPDSPSGSALTRGAVLWQVTALRGTEKLARSSTETLRIP